MVSWSVGGQVMPRCQRCKKNFQGDGLVCYSCGSEILHGMNEEEQQDARQFGPALIIGGVIAVTIAILLITKMLGVW